MDRWNELIAGYVLGNLTAEEREELEQILAEHPQLNDRILQLRQTATLRGGLPENRIPAYTADQPVSPTIQATHAKGFVTKGAEGWTDGLSGGPSLANWEVNSHTVSLHTVSSHTVNSVQSRFTQDKHTDQERSQPDPSSQLPSKSNRRNRNRSDRDWGNACTKNSWQNPLLHNPLWWLLVLVTIGLGIDNMRVRRSLTRMKDKTTYTHMGERPPTLWEDPYNNRWETQ